jgi:hypothetical protein
MMDYTNRTSGARQSDDEDLGIPLIAEHKGIIGELRLARG